MYTASDLTPVELRNGMHYKRDDLLRDPAGPNGSKYRACRHLLTQAMARGYDHVVTAQATASPQSSICATLAAELGMKCTVVVGASKPATAVLHPNIAIAMRANAQLDTGCRVAYNGTLQPYARALAERLGAYQLPYAISVPAIAPEEDVRAFLQVGAVQTMNLPDEIETLVIPFGSGNTAAGVLYGLRDWGPAALQRVVLMGIGPDRQDWLHRRMQVVGRPVVPAGVTLEHIPLHPHFAVYSDRMPETEDGITFHQIYEGKCIRWLNTVQPEWWIRRDDTTCFWIVGGPVS